MQYQQQPYAAMPQPDNKIGQPPPYPAENKVEPSAPPPAYNYSS